MRRGVPQILLVNRLPEGTKASATDPDIDRWENEGGASGRQKRGLAKAAGFQRASMRK